MPPYAVELVGILTSTIGLLVALVVGIGMILTDVSPPLNTFWRSRPINPDLWFWTKFCGTVPYWLAPVSSV